VPRPLYRRGNSSPYSLDGPQRSSGRGAEKKNRLRPPFLRSSNPWRSHPTDRAACIVELYRVSFFAVKWKTFRSVGVTYRCVCCAHLTTSVIRSFFFLLYTPDYFRYKQVLLYTPIYFRDQVRCSADKAKHHLRAHLCRHKQRHEA
jgi:hypothetical protein